MKKILNIILFIFILTSCSKNEYEKQLIGKWNNFPIGGMTDITFYKDSIVSYDYSDRRVGTWKADSDKIHIHFPKKIEGLREKLTLFYRFSSDRDSLFTKLDTDTIGENFVLLRVTDKWKHYLREFDLQIDLPNANFEMIKNDSMNFGVNLYIGLRNNKLSIENERWDSNKYNILDNIHQFVFSKRAQYKEAETKHLYFNLIIDKNISNQKIDSIKNILRKFPNMKHFRVYKNDSANYGDYYVENYGEYWHWYGRYE